MKMKWLASVVISVSLVSSYVVADTDTDIDETKMDHDSLYRILDHNDWRCKENSEYILFKAIMKKEQAIHKDVIKLMSQGRFEEGNWYISKYTDKLRTIKRDNLDSHFRNTCGFYIHRNREFSL